MCAMIYVPKAKKSKNSEKIEKLKKISYNDYDSFEDEYMFIKTTPYLPSKEQLEKIEKLEAVDKKKFRSWLLMLIWCHDQSPKRSELPEEDRKRKDALQAFITKYFDEYIGDEEE